MGVTPFSACQISLGLHMVAMMSTRRLLEQQEIHQHKTGKHVAHNRDCQQSKTSDKRPDFIHVLDKIPETPPHEARGFQQ